MDSLPNEIILLILKFCDVKSVLNLAQISKRVKELKKLLKDRMLIEPVHYLGLTCKDVLFSFNGPSIGKLEEFTMIFDGIVVKDDKLVLCGKLDCFKNDILIRSVSVDCDGDGEVTCYFENGKFRGKFDVFRTDVGFINVYYYENGSIRELIPEVDGEWHGNVVECYRNGSVKDVTPYVHGKSHGTSKEYYETGELSNVSHYEFGKQQGEMHYYDRDGKIILKLLYEDSVQVRVLESNGVVYAAT